MSNVREQVNGTCGGAGGPSSQGVIVTFVCFHFCFFSFILRKVGPVCQVGHGNRSLEFRRMERLQLDPVSVFKIVS